MADSNDTSQFRLDLDTAEFIVQANQASLAIQGIGSSENLSGLIEGLASAAPLIGALAVAFFGVKEAFDAVFEGENIKAVNAEFESLTKQAGVFGDTLKEKLVTAANGWVDETSLMQAANKAMLGMDTGIEHLGDLMEIARQRSAVMGGTILDSFNEITRAVETGSTRQLRHLGIIVDQQKAYRDYAVSIGLTVDVLSTAGKQQAVLNAVLDDAKKHLSANQDELKRTQTAWAQLKTSFVEFKDTVATIFEQTLGPIFSKFLQLSKSVADGITGSLRAVAPIMGINLKLTKDSTAASADQLAQEKKTADEKLAIEQKRSTDAEAFAKKKAESQKELAALDNQLTQEELKNVNTIKAADALYETQKQNIIKQTEAQEAQINAKVAQGLMNKNQARAMNDRLDQISIEKQKALELDLEATRQRALDNYAKQSAHTFAGISAGATAASHKSQVELVDMSKVGANAVAAFGTSATSNIAAFGAGTKSATDAVGGMFAGMAGGMAMQYGELMLLSSVWPPNPIGLAGGAALIALGGYLNGLSGGSSSASSSPAVSASGGSGMYLTPPGAAPLASTGATPSAVTAAPQKAVTINIQGNYMDTEQTRQALVQMIRTEQDATDYNINKLGSG